MVDSGPPTWAANIIFASPAASVSGPQNTCRYAALDARAAADNSRLSDEYQASTGMVQLGLVN